ncbi:DUF305 domain-containing protein [Dermatophilaceae bacterium Soc4.6]
MIPHHTQAVTMAAMATTAATTADVRTLAAAISAAQAPEIQTMSGWLAGWGAPVPETAAGAPGMAGMSGMGEGTSDGMMTDQQMSDLGSATGLAFDRMWRQLMISHHQGAVAMSTTELSAGENPEAKALAQSIIDGQSTEITTMERLLAAAPGS